VKALEFYVGYLVLKHVIRSIEEKNVEKLGANCEGPYTVVAKRGKYSYTLAVQDGKIQDPRPEYAQAYSGLGSPIVTFWSRNLSGICLRHFGKQ